jgi:ATP-dependent RNA helicase DeaD
MLQFQDFGLRADLLANVAALGFETPTPVQAEVIPAALKGAGDLVALAQTGTGKTAAFGLPLLHLLDDARRDIEALVLCPTRELCVQVASDLAKYAGGEKLLKVVAVYGGAGIEGQIRQLKMKPRIIVATPGRLIDLIDRKAIDLSVLSRVVLDEADEMLNMGFRDDLDTILAACTNRQSVWLFSATMAGEVRRIAKQYMKSPLEISVGTANQANASVQHSYYVCRPDDRYMTLKRIVDATPGIYGLIFCRTRADAREIADAMTKDGYNADALHGDLSQSDRDRVMAKFRDRSLQLLIATDVAARGLDVRDISHVIHYGLPDDTEVYNHRSGRTGRAGKTGHSMAIVTTTFSKRIPFIERSIGLPIERKNIPSSSEVCSAQLMHIVQNIHDTEVHMDLIEPFLPQIMESLGELSKEDLIARFASVEFNRFLAYYRNAPDLNVYPRGQKRDGDSPFKKSFSESGEPMVRLFTNIGEIDGITHKDFLFGLQNQIGVPKNALGRIDLSRTCTHFEVAEKFVPQVIREMGQMEVGGRRVRVNEADSDKKKFSASAPSKGGFTRKRRT